MNRRALVLSMVSSCITSFPLNAYARLSCGPFVPPGIQQCEAGIDSSLASITAAAVGGQHFSEWCWAACIEMAFTYYGHPVPQERIVSETWGGIINLPGQPSQILENLNRDWTDENGDDFSVTGDTYSVNAITAAQDLAQDMPLIIGTMGHAMVLSSLVYVRDGFGRGNVNAAIVRDPWPGRGRRVLTPQEWSNINFAVRIRVS